MIPIPRVARVLTCSHCAAPDRPVKGKPFLVVGDGPVVCRDCIHMAVRLAGVSVISVNDDGTVNE